MAIDMTIGHISFLSFFFKLNPSTVADSCISYWKSQCVRNTCQMNSLRSLCKLAIFEQYSKQKKFQSARISCANPNDPVNIDLLPF